MFKKAASPVIAWILLIGITVSIAAGVITWQRSHAEKLTEETVTFITGRMECEQIKISAEKITACPDINITNRGTLTINKVSIRSDQAGGILNTQIIPAATLASLALELSSQDLNIGIDYKKIEIMPLLSVDKKLYGCTDKKLVIECP